MNNIIIAEKEIIKAGALGMDEFLNAFTDAYISRQNETEEAQKMNLLNGYQHTLLAYRYLCEEVRQGGFVQLIQNGYGGYIFDNPFAKGLRLLGATEMSKLIYKAKKIYDENRIALTKETTEEQFMAMYVDFEEFDVLEEQFFEIEEQQTAIVASFVDEHIAEFGEIK